MTCNETGNPIDVLSNITASTQDMNKGAFYAGKAKKGYTGREIFEMSYPAVCKVEKETLPFLLPEDVERKPRESAVVEKITDAMHLINEDEELKTALDANLLMRVLAVYDWAGSKLFKVMPHRWPEDFLKIIKMCTDGCLKAY